MAKTNSPMLVILATVTRCIIRCENVEAIGAIILITVVQTGSQCSTQLADSTGAARTLWCVTDDQEKKPNRSAANNVASFRKAFFTLPF